MLERSKTVPTVGRIIHVYSPDWEGPRPAMVVGVNPDGSCNVNVQCDGEVDKGLLAMVRSRDSGNTFCGLDVYDPMSDEQRAEMDVHAEWMPFQVGQAQKQTKQDTTATDVDTLKDMVLAMALRLEKEATGHPQNGLHRDMCDIWLNRRGAVSGEGDPVEIKPA